MSLCRKKTTRGVDRGQLLFPCGHLATDTVTDAALGALEGRAHSFRGIYTLELLCQPTSAQQTPRTASYCLIESFAAMLPGPDNEPPSLGNPGISRDTLLKRFEIAVNNNGQDVCAESPQSHLDRASESATAIYRCHMTTCCAVRGMSYSSSGCIFAIGSLLPLRSRNRIPIFFPILLYFFFVVIFPSRCMDGIIAPQSHQFWVPQAARTSDAARC